MNTNLSEELRRFEAEIALGPKFNAAFIPHQVAKNAPRPPPNSVVSIMAPSTVTKSSVHQPKVSTNLQNNMQMTNIPLEKNPMQPEMSVTMNVSAAQESVERKLKKLQKARQEKIKKNELAKTKAALNTAALGSTSSGKSHKNNDGKKKTTTKNRKLLRMAAGTVWEDITLAEWPEDDYRLFCGDLGNDVTDELLVRHFSKYPSFQKARVIRDRRNNKSKGYGFVSFKDPNDFSRAMKEMNGKYVGSRPIKLKKSCWKNRSIDAVRKREKEKNAIFSLYHSGLNKPIA